MDGPAPVEPSFAAGIARRLIDAAHRVTKPVLLDIGNVPDHGPFLLVGNHQLLGMQDLPTLVREVERRRGVLVRGMADRAHFAIPGWRDLLASMGAVVGSRENCRALLAAGEAVLVLPGGAREVYKRRDQRYQLLWEGRLGFAKLAIEAGCPVVPFAAVGAEDRFDVVLDVDHPLARPVKVIAKRLGRDDVGTVLVRGTGVGLLPTADRLYFRFGAPIAGHDDPVQLRDAVQAEVERLIADLLAHREHDPRRSLLSRIRGGP